MEYKLTVETPQTVKVQLQRAKLSRLRFRKNVRLENNVLALLHYLSWVSPLLLMLRAVLAEILFISMEFGCLNVAPPRFTNPRRQHWRPTRVPLRCDHLLPINFSIGMVTKTLIQLTGSSHCQAIPMGNNKRKHKTPYYFPCFAA